MDKKYYVIYKITCCINNKIYIGQHGTNNINDNYMGSGSLLKNDIKLFGVDKFNKEILYIYDTWKECDKKESEIVNEDFIAREDTYNFRLGGGFGENVNNLNYQKFSNLGHIALLEKLKNDDDFRNAYCEKISARSKKLWNDEKYRNNQLNNNPCLKGECWKGKRHTTETKKKISQASSIHQKGEGNSQYGTCWIYNDQLQINKKILKTELNIWISQGWNKGRKIKF